MATILGAVVSVVVKAVCYTSVSLHPHLKESERKPRSGSLMLQDMFILDNFSSH